MEYPYKPPNGDEEDLNQQVVGHLHYSLQFDATLINKVHQSLPFEFSADAEIIAHQQSPLSKSTPDGPDREIDWVIRDTDKLVGYESKYGDSLGETQLRDELAKLQLNASEQAVHLIAVTPHATPPSTIEQFDDEPVYWLSWTTISRHIHRLTEADLPAEQQPIRQMLEDLFTAENMIPFTGFDHHDKRQYQYFVRDLCQELTDTALENYSGKVHTWAQKTPTPKSYQRLVPKYLDVPFVHEDRPVGEPAKTGTKRYSYFPVIIDLETNEVYAGIVFNVKRVPGHSRFVDEHRDDLIAYAQDQELELWVSTNSINNREKPPQQTTDPDQMADWLSDAGNEALYVDGSKYKRALFLKKCTNEEPDKMLDAVRGELTKHKANFLDVDDLFEYPTLEYIE